MNRFKTALELQDAVNIRAIARELVKAADAAAADNSFPLSEDAAIILIVGKLESMVFSEQGQRFSVAYGQCQERAQSPT
jgi:hypothetical protein